MRGDAAVHRQYRRLFEDAREASESSRSQLARSDEYAHLQLADRDDAYGPCSGFLGRMQGNPAT